MKKLLESTVQPLLAKLLPMWIEVKSVEGAKANDEFRVEGAVKSVKALKRRFRVDVVFVVEE